MKAPREGSLDALRGVAAAMVVGYHYLFKGPAEGWIQPVAAAAASAVASYGYLGVHVFFMISGYVIMLTAERASLRGFVASRVSRLVPAFWVCCLLTSAVQAMYPSPMAAPGLWQVAANLTLLPVWFGADFVDGAYWSLQVEITFYAWVALLVALGAASRLERALAAWLVLSTVNAIRPMYRLELVTCVQWAPLFAFGATCYFARTRTWNTTRRVMAAVCVLLAVVYAWREAVSLQLRLPVGPAVQAPAVVVTVLVLSMLGFAWLTTRARPVPASPLTGVLGNITYPLYLLHQNIGYVAFTVARTHFGFAGARAWALFAIVASGAAASAWGVHVLVERRAGPWLRRAIDDTPRRPQPA